MLIEFKVNFKLDILLILPFLRPGKNGYIEVKSGQNDMDKTQILSYDKAIKKVLKHNEKAFFGITYG